MVDYHEAWRWADEDRQRWIGKEWQAQKLIRQSNAALKRMKETVDDMITMWSNRHIESPPNPGDPMDLTHLHALELIRHNESLRLKAATSKSEIAQREVWLNQIDKEVASERKFLGLPPEYRGAVDMSDDDLLNELES